MTLDDLLSTVAGSEVKDWSVIHCGPAPSYLDRVVITTSPRQRRWLSKSDSATDWRLHHDSHSMRAIYRDDVSIGLAYGMDKSMMGIDDDDRVLHFEWAKKFADPKVYGRWLDVLWNGSLVHRQLLLSVDGGRALLPSPHVLFVPTAPSYGEVVGGSVGSEEVAIARLVHCFEYQEVEFATCMKVADFTIADDPDA